MNEVPTTTKKTGVDKPLTLPANFSRHHMWWLVGLVAAALISVVVGDDFKKALSAFLPETMPNQSTYNDKQSGSSGLYDLCKKMGLDVERYQQSYRRIDVKNFKGTLVMIAPFELPTPGEISVLSDWIHSGNDLIYLDDLSLRSSKELIGAMGLSAHTFKARADDTLKVDDAIAESALAKQLKVDVETRLEGGTKVASDELGAALVEIKVGKGRVLLGTCPGLCSNEKLIDNAYKSNFQFLINWLSTSKAPIYFDEKCHGYSSSDNIFAFVLRSWVGYVVLQFLIVLAVALISLNQRFGPAQKVPSGRLISNLEFINGLAQSYQRARARDTVWAMIYQPFKAKLCRQLSIAPHESPQKLAQAWAAEFAKPQVACEEFLVKSQAVLEKRHLDDAELVALVGKLDELTKDDRLWRPSSKITGA